jgi:hypothetical protein
MDPTDPVWSQPGPSGSSEDSPPRKESDEDLEAEFVDFAEEEAEEPRGAEDAGVTPRQWIWMVLLPLGFTFLLTMLFLAMRGVLDEGGMVARGGPYEIAHPAPDYWWIFPVSIIGMILIVFISMGMFSFGSGTGSSVSLPFTRQGYSPQGHGRVSLVALFFWPAIFLSLGWNFCEYGFFSGEGLVWGWIVCGVIFILMGGLPLYLVARKTTGRELLAAARDNKSSLWPQLLGIIVGIPLGILFFNAVS